MDNTKTGNQGEELACKYLKKLGYKILERNYRIRGGEIDIVAKDKDYLVFVEVKTRYSHEYGLPVESMVSWKIKHLLKTAQFYISSKARNSNSAYLLKIKWEEKPFRLDFVSVDFANDPQKPEIELIKNITE